MIYKAFISYSHAADGKLAPALQSALHRFAKPWYRLRSMRVFRDQTTLSATPALWGSIETALTESEYFLLFASPEAAASEWVGREIDWWLSHREIDRLFILLTHGDLEWTKDDFDWSQTDALPATLKGRFKNEPLWVDLRWAKGENDLSLRHQRFRAAVLDLAAPLLCRAKDELDGEDVRQNRRVHRLAWAAGIALGALAVATGIAAYNASRQRDAADVARNAAVESRNEAQRQEKLATDREREVRRTLAASDFNQANGLLRTGAAAGALAYLARSIRTERASYDAANLLCSVLLTRNFPLLVSDSLRHEGEIASATFSPDSRSILTAGDQTARIWSAPRGEPSGEPLRHDFTVEGADYSPDGKRVLTVGKTVNLWEAQTGKLVASVQEDATASFSPDGNRIAIVRVGALRVIDSRTNKPIGKPLKADIFTFEFSPDGESALVRQSDGNVFLWTVASGQRKPVGQTGKRPSDSGRETAPNPLNPLDPHVSQARFSPMGDRIVSAAGHMAQVWSAATGRPLGQPLKHSYVVQDAAFSPDGERVLTASFDGTARLWDAATGDPLGAPMKHESANSGTFSADGLRALTVSYDDTTVRLWDARTGTAIGEPIMHEAEISKAEFSPDGRMVLTISSDQRGRIWDVRPKSALQLLLSHPAETTAADISPDGRFVVSGDADNTARLWDALTGKSVGVPMVHARAGSTPVSPPERSPDSDKFIDLVRFSPDGSVVFTSSSDNSVRFWDAKTGVPLCEPLPVAEYASHASFSFNGKMLFFTSGSEARLFAASIGKAIGQPMIHGESIEKACLSADGRRAVTATNSTVHVWDTGTRQQLFEFDHEHGSIEWIDLSPNDQEIVTAGTDKLVRFWDAASGQAIKKILKHNHTVLTVRYSRDGSRLVTGSWDKTARIWDALTGEPIGAPMEHANYVGSAEFSADGTRILTVSGGGDGNEGRVWSGKTGRPISEPIGAGSAEAIRFVPGGDRLLMIPEGGSVVALCDLPSVSEHDSPSDLAFLADLAEAAGGCKLVPAGEGERLVMMNAAERAAILKGRAAAIRADEPHPQTSLRRFLDWYLADPAVRTISPLAELSTPEWVSRQIGAGSVESGREAMLRDWENPLVNAHLGRLLARLAISAPQTAEGKRARAEADFFTMRAIKLDPKSTDAGDARAEVVKLLEIRVR